MNVFYIPSWYPSREERHLCSFTREQAISIGSCQPDCHLAIALWAQEGGNDYSCSLRKPLKLLKNLFHVLKSPSLITPLHPNVTEYDTLVLKWSPRFLNGNMKGILKACRKHMLKAQSSLGKIDVIHAHVSYPGGYIAMKLSEEFNIPYIITEHMNPFPLPHFFENGKISDKVTIPLKNADAIVAVSPALASTIEQFGLPKPHVIPNVIDENFFYPSEAIRATTKPFQFLALGAITFEKGIDELLQAISKFVERFPSVPIECIIGGPAKNMSFYTSLVDKLKIAPYITWVGPLPPEQVREAFHSCDCFILPSRQETFGLVYAEAHACGKPAIGTICGGPESIITKETGLLIQPGDVEAIVTAMKTMIDSKELYSMQEIRNSFLSRFSKPAVTNQIMSLYKRVTHSPYA